MRAAMSESNSTAYVNNSFIFFSQLMSYFSSVLIVFCQFFTWVSLSDVDLLLSLVFVGKASAVEEETT
jgi:hypothetical protein